MDQVRLSDLTLLLDTDLPSFKEKLECLGGIDGLCSALNSSSTHGLHDSIVPRNRRLFGRNTHPNYFASGNERSFCDLFHSRDLVISRIAFYCRSIPHFTSLIIGVLFGFDLSVFVDMYFIFHPLWAFLTIAIPLIILFWINYSLTVNAGLFPLAAGEVRRVHVIRGRLPPIPILCTELVVGDVCDLSQEGAGIVVPADGVLLGDEVQNEDDDPRVYSGEINLDGGKILILAVGGNIRGVSEQPLAGPGPATVQHEKPNSPLQDQMYHFYQLVIKLAFIFGIVTGGVLVARFGFEVYYNENGEMDANPSISYAQRFIMFIIRGFDIFILALPELIPPFIYLSHALNIRRCKKDGILVKSWSALFTVPSLTLLLIEEDCLQILGMTSRDLKKIIDMCRTQMKVQILTGSHGPQLDESFYSDSGLNVHLDLIGGNSNKSKVEIVNEMKGSGELVGYLGLRLASNAEAFQAAHLGIIVGSKNNTGSIGGRTAGVYLIPNPKCGVAQTLNYFFERGHALITDTNSMLQIRLPGLVLICGTTFISALIDSYASGLMTNTRTAWICILTNLLIFGQLWSTTHENPSKRIRRTQLIQGSVLKNILIQIAYQGIVICALALHEEWIHLVFNAIVWMTLFNGFNGRKSGGEGNVFGGVSTRDPFLWIWVLGAICQIFIVRFGQTSLNKFGELGLLDWLISILLGFGTLLVYQVSIRIPIWKHNPVDNTSPSEDTHV